MADNTNDIMQRIIDEVNSNKKQSSYEGYVEKTSKSLADQTREYETLVSLLSELNNETKDMFDTTGKYSKELDKIEQQLKKTKEYSNAHSQAFHSINAVSKIYNKNLSESAKILAGNLQTYKEELKTTKHISESKLKTLNLQISLTKELGKTAAMYEKLEKSSIEFMKNSMVSNYMKNIGKQDPMLHAALSGKKDSSAPIRSIVGASMHKKSLFNKEQRQKSDMLPSEGLVTVMNTVAIAMGLASNAALDLANTTVQSFNKMWGGVQGTLKMMRDGVAKAFGAMNTKLGAVAGGIGDSIINTMLFSWEDDVKRQLIQQKLQVGYDAEGSNLSGAFDGRLRGLVGRGAAAETIQGIADIGAFDIGGETATQIGIYSRVMGESLTPLIGTMMSFKDTGEEAFQAVSGSMDMLRASAKESQVPIKNLMKYYQDASQQLRIFNIDQKVVASTLSAVTAQTKELAAVGIDVRTQAGALTQDMLNVGRLQEGAMAYFGSNRGKGDPIEGWMRGMIGDKAADQVLKGGWGSLSGKEFTENDTARRMMRGQFSMMMEATQGIEDPAKAGMMRYKMAKQFGMSDVGARAMMRTENMDQLNQLLEANPKMLDEMKSEKELLSTIKDTSVKSENIQRELSNIVGTILAQIILLPLALENKMKATFGPIINKLGGNVDVDKALKMGQLIDETSMRMSYKVGQSFKKIGKEVGEVGSAMPGISSAMDLYKLDSTTKKKKAFGGAVFDVGSYLVGEHGPEIFTPSTAGKITNTMDTQNLMKKAQSFTPKIPDTLQSITDKYKPQLPGGNGSSMNTSGENVVNLNVSGLNKEQLISEVVKQVRERLW